MHKMGSAPARPEPPRLGCILPWLIRAEPSPCTRQKRISVSHTSSTHGVSAQKLTGKDGEVGDAESQAAAPGAMQRAQNPKET